jgi:tRNA(Ile)-lysidine synthase
MAATKKKSRAELPTRLAGFLKQHLTARRDAGSLLSAGGVFQWVVALSGGRDSVALLCATQQALDLLAVDPDLPACQLRAVHVHHGLSANAEQWTAFCQELCARLAVPLTVQRVEVDRLAPSGLEAAARAARYAAFTQLPADQADALLLGHHREDQAATVLFKLLRGAGVAGAAGMAVERGLARPGGLPLTLLRPWLDTPRAELEAYLHGLDQDWIDDDSNADPRFSRNFLRQEVMPALREHFPAPEQALARAAGVFAEAQLLLDERAEEDWRAAMSESTAPLGRLPLAALASLSPERSRNLLRYALRRSGMGAPAAATLEEWRLQLCHAATASATAQVALQAGAWQVHGWRGEVWIEPLTVAPMLEQPFLLPEGDSAWRQPWAEGWITIRETMGEGMARQALLDLAGELRWSCREIESSLRLGREEAASHLRLQPDALRPRRPLKDLWQMVGVPPWRRGRLPLLLAGERLLWAAGIGADAALACPPGAVGVVLEWLPPET